MKKIVRVFGSTLMIALLIWPALTFAQAAQDPGKYLAYGPAGCANCHGEKLDGHNTPPIFIPQLADGKIRPPSLRGLKAKGYTPPLFIQAVRDGVRPDGSRIHPPMPVKHFERGFCAAQLEALADYVFGLEEFPDSPSVPATTFRVPAPEYAAVSAPPACPSAGDSLATGRLLLEQAHCTECHGHDYTGGHVFHAEDGKPFAVAPDIRRIVHWPVDLIMQTLITGKNQEGHELKIMCPACFTNLTPTDLWSLVSALLADIRVQTGEKTTGQR
jgi:mono/diheme cytochrome c family protein